MVFTQLRKMAWLNIAIKMMVVVSLLTPRVAWGECHCTSGSCTRSVKVAPEKEHSEKCCCTGSTCSCCQSEEKSKPDYKGNSEQPSRGEPSTPSSTEDADPSSFSLPEYEISNAKIKDACSVCPDGCDCCKMEVHWPSPAPLTSRITQPDDWNSFSLLDYQILLSNSNVGTETGICPLLRPVTAHLQPLFCRWQV